MPVIGTLYKIQGRNAQRKGIADTQSFFDNDKLNKIYYPYKLSDQTDIDKVYRMRKVYVAYCMREQ